MVTHSEPGWVPLLHGYTFRACLKVQGHGGAGGCSEPLSLEEVKTVVAYLESTKDGGVPGGRAALPASAAGAPAQPVAVVDHVYELGGCEIFLSLMTRSVWSGGYTCGFGGGTPGMKRGYIRGLQ